MILDYLVGRSNKISYITMSRPTGQHKLNYLITCVIKVASIMAKINIPLQIVPFLLFKLRQVGRGGMPRHTINLLVNILRSVTFMTSYVISIRFMQQTSSYLPK